MIFYFSATGNSKWATQYLAKAIGDKAVCISDQPNADIAYTLEPDERIGFIFPVHGWRPPTIVKAFVEKLNICLPHSATPYVYALCTAGDTIGETMDIFKHLLARKGLVLNAAFSLLMPESYVGLPFMNVDTPANERKKKENAKTELQAIAKRIINRQTATTPPAIGRWPRINSRLIGSIFVRYLITDKPFRVESQRCIKCGICAEVCPTNNIDGGKGLQPQWKHNGTCLTCFACYHHCPRHAIEFGRQTKHKGQYFYK